MKGINRCKFWLLAVCLFILPAPAQAGQTLTFSTPKEAVFKAPIVQRITEAYQQLGIGVRIREFPAQRSIVEAGLGACDGELFRIKGIEKDFPDLIMVDVPCFEVQGFIYLPREKAFEVAGWESIPSGYTMAAPFGIKYIEKAIETHGLKAFFIKGTVNALDFLLSGKADYTISTKELDGLLVHRNLQASLVRLTPPVERIPVFHYLHKQHADLVPRIRKVLMEMHENQAIKSPGQGKQAL